MEEEMVIDGYNVVVNLDDGYLYLSSVNGIEVTHLSDSAASLRNCNREVTQRGSRKPR